MGLLGLFLAEDASTIERSAMTEPELDSVINEAAALDPSDPQRQQFIQRVNRGMAGKNRVVPTEDLTLRAAYSIRAHMLPDPIRQAISSGRLKIVNKAFYKIDVFTGKQGELMANADTKQAGVTNVNNRKLEQNDYFLLTSIILQSANIKKDDKPGLGDFGIPCKEILGGEFSLKNGAKVIVHPSSAMVFGTSSRKDVILGEWKLDNPKFIAPQVEIIPELKLGVDAPTTTTHLTAVKLVLIGAGLEKA